MLVVWFPGSLIQAGLLGSVGMSEVFIELVGVLVLLFVCGCRVLSGGERGGSRRD